VRFIISSHLLHFWRFATTAQGLEFATYCRWESDAWWERDVGKCGRLGRWVQFVDWLDIWKC